MAKNLKKCPSPKNFSTTNVSLSVLEVKRIKSGFYEELTVLKYNNPSEVLFTRKITKAMIDSIKNMGKYYLMSYKPKK